MRLPFEAKLSYIPKDKEKLYSHWACDTSYVIRYPVTYRKSLNAL